MGERERERERERSFLTNKASRHAPLRRPVSVSKCLRERERERERESARARDGKHVNVVVAGGSRQMYHIIKSKLSPQY